MSNTTVAQSGHLSVYNQGFGVNSISIPGNSGSTLTFQFTFFFNKGKCGIGIRLTLWIEMELAPRNPVYNHVHYYIAINVVVFQFKVPRFWCFLKYSSLSISLDWCICSLLSVWIKSIRTWLHIVVLMYLTCSWFFFDIHWKQVE